MTIGRTRLPTIFSVPQVTKCPFPVTTGLTVGYRPSTIASLSKCKYLHTLDLTGVPTMNIRLLFDTLQCLRRLRYLRFPCQLTNSDGISWGAAYAWPPKLRELHLYGIINDAHPLFCDRFPRNLTHLTIESCPRLGCAAGYRWLEATGHCLEHFEVCDWVPKSDTDYLDNIPWHLPLIRHLNIPHKCITWYFVLNMLRRRYLPKRDRPVTVERDNHLETLEIRHQGSSSRRPLTTASGFDHPVTPWMMLILV